MADRAEAYRVLGVDPNVVAASVRISTYFQQVGGMTQALNALRASPDRPARLFISIYDNMLLPEWVRRALPFEAFCVAAGIDPTDVWDSIVTSFRRMNASVASIKASNAHPEVIDAVIASAKKGDEKSIMHLLKHMAFLPQAKGAGVQITNVVSAEAKSAALPAPIVSPEDIVRRMSDRFNQARVLEGEEVKALPEPKVIDLPVIGRKDEIEVER